LSSPLRVLVVDDNPHAREILAAMARSWGWQVDVAEDGTQAIALVNACAQANQPGYQTIFVDWQMPEMDGWETCLRIRQIMGAQATPLIVMVTAHGREMLSLRTPKEQAQINGFLVKPITASMLFDAVNDARAAQNPALPTPLALKPQTNQLAGLRLLVVEDNLINQQVAQELLSARGAVVTLAVNGHLGVEAVAHAQPMFDAVLMDLQMPVMDGYTATRIIRADLGLTELPIIAMTANAMASDRAACLAAGMNEHVGKPFNLNHLTEVVLRLTQGRRTANLAKQASPILSPPPQADVDSDVENALERLGHNTELYVKVLTSYLEDIANLPDQLDTTLLAGDRLGAIRLLHTLKGLSATVGASELAAVAKQVEDVLKTANTSLAHDALRDMLRAAVRRAEHTMGEVAARLTKTTPRYSPGQPHPARDDAALRPLLSELRELLNQSDMRSLEVYSGLRDALGQSAPLTQQELDSALAVFDFSRGAICCAAWLLQPSPPSSTPLVPGTAYPATT
jgi:CheY-like chemotaxis protein